MAIKFHKKLKDKLNRKNFLMNEKKIRYYKFIRLKYEKILLSSDMIIKKKAVLLLNKLQFNYQSLPVTKINNYCILTGRDKGVYRDFKLSRHQIKQNFKYLTGLRNSSF